MVEVALSLNASAINYSTLSQDIIDLLEQQSRYQVLKIKDCNRRTILHRLASLPGSLPVTTLFPRKDYNIGQFLIEKDADGQTLFHCFAMGKRISLSVLVFWEICAKVSLMQNKKGQSPVHIAIGNSDTGIIVLMRHLGIAKSVKLMSQVNLLGYTPLHWAIKKACDPDLV